MVPPERLVTVCIASIGRASLSFTVVSLFEQALPPGILIAIVIADDSTDGSVRSYLDVLADDARVTIVRSGAQNIAVARNLVKDAAGDAAFIAFIDDDEIADPDWIASLIDALDESGADVVFGPVEPIFAPDCPTWASEAGVFRKRPATGRRPVLTGATSNVLIRNGDVVRRTTFDPAFGRSGGEDTVFFDALRRARLTLIATNRGAVREHVPSERLALPALRRRYMRGGHTHAIVGAPDRSRPVRLVRAVAKLLARGAGTAIAMGKGRRIRRELQFWAAVGELRQEIGISRPLLYSVSSNTRRPS